MSSIFEAEQTETSFPLELTVQRNGAGLTGLLPTVSIRNAATLNSYLDFFDNTFKIAGWTTKFLVMSEVGRGLYHATLNILSLSLVVGTKLSIEYHVDNGLGVVGDDADVALITRKLQDISLTRKYSTNKLVANSGAPGQLTLFDDDGFTAIKTHTLVDEIGGAIQPSYGVPSNRSAGTP